MSSDEALRRMTKLVNSLLARGDAQPFREPVDWRGLELYDYPKIIKKLMDLGAWVDVYEFLLLYIFWRPRKRACMLCGFATSC